MTSYFMLSNMMDLHNSSRLAVTPTDSDVATHLYLSGVSLHAVSRSARWAGRSRSR